MPMIVGALGGIESRLTDTGTVVVPPALVALQVSVAAPSGMSVAGQTSGLAIGDSGSVRLQLTRSGPRYQPLAPSGVAGERIGTTRGGVVSRPCARALSASTRPAPQSIAGWLVVQALAFAGFRRIAYSASTL